MRAARAAVIFDLDGVLVDTVDAHFRAWSRVARRLGVPFERADNELLRGVSGPQSLARLTAGRPPLAEAERAALLELKSRVYRQYVARDPGRFRVPGVRRMLAELRGRGVALAIASASRHARRLIAATGLDGTVDAVSDGHFAGPAKPAPDQLLALARELAVAPAACTVVEDGLVGVEAALTAGMRVIGVGPLAASSPRLDAHLASLAGVPAAALLSVALREAA